MEARTRRSGPHRDQCSLYGGLKTQASHDICFAAKQIRDMMVNSASMALFTQQIEEAVRQKGVNVCVCIRFHVCLCVRVCVGMCV